jgi:hypothetical protein
MDPLAWTASAAVEQLRAAVERARGHATGPAVARGIAFVERAMKIDPALVPTVNLHDALVREAERTR